MIPSISNTNQHESSALLTTGAQLTSQQQQSEAMMVGVVHQLPCFRDLIAVLFECLLIISLGYLSCHFKLISSQAKDLNSYLTTFALPMIIFLNIAQMEFQTINLSFLLCMLTAKLLVFVIVTILTLTISYPTNFAYAGSLSILATQSNDFALGYPLIKSLYGEVKPEMLNYLSLMAPIQLLILNPLGIMMLEFQKSRDQQVAEPADAGRPSELEVCVQCQSSKSSSSGCHHADSGQLNQFGARGRDSLGRPAEEPAADGGDSIGQSKLQAEFKDRRLRTLSEFKQRNTKALTLALPARDQVEQVAECASDDSGDFVGPISTCTCEHVIRAPIKRAGSRVNLAFLKALATNPLIIASVVALMVNLINGPELPRFVTRVSNTIAASFAAPALFVVGLSMYGKFELLIRKPSDLLLSSALVITKVILLPNLMRTLALLILPRFTPAEELPYLTDFTFLYGFLPTAPTACIIAKQYGVLSNVFGISMLLSTIISAPLMLGASIIINPSTVVKANSVAGLVADTVSTGSALTLCLATLTLLTFWRLRNKMRCFNLMNIPRAAADRLHRIKYSPSHVFLVLLSISQLMVGLGGAVWLFVETDEKITLDLNGILNSSMSESDQTERIPSELALDEPTHLKSGQVHSWLNRHKLDIGLNTLISAHYALASAGLMMVRLVTLCMLVTMVASKLRGTAYARKVSSQLVKISAIFATAVIIWLIVDSQQIKHLPDESSLPSQHDSLYIRLVHNALFLVLSIPLFAYMIKADNKERKALKSEDQAPSQEESESEVGPALARRRFVTSNTSLTSETSSALTTNTNLELTTSQNAQNPIEINNNNNNNINSNNSNNINSNNSIMNPTQILNESLSIVVDGRVGELTQRRPTSPSEVQTIETSANMHGPYGATIIEPRSTTSTSHRPSNGNHHAGTLTELNEYSVLVLLVIVDSLFNMTSIAQKLLQEPQSGTFGQVEIMNGALDFGQGLLTFGAISRLQRRFNFDGNNPIDLRIDL